MAIRTYLYSASPVTSTELDPLLAIGVPYTIGDALGASLIPITIDDANKTDLDDAMLELGYVYVSEYTGVATLQGRQDYGVLATDPVGITPGTGDMYYNSILQMEMRYDNVRSKWLSVESQRFQFGRDGATAVDQYFRGADGRVLSDSIGWYAERSGTIISMAYTRSNSVAMAFEVTANGAALGNLPSSAVGGRSVALNFDFNFGDVLAVRNAGAGVPDDVNAVLGIKWRV
jgi:hypothetical protein